VKEGALQWLTESLQLFGPLIAVKPHAAFARHCLSHANPSVRSTCVDYLGALYSGVGASLKLLFKQEKQATIDLLEEKFSSVSGTALPKPTRFERSAKSATASGDGGDDDNDDDDEDAYQDASDGEGDDADDNDGGGGGGQGKHSSRADVVDTADRVSLVDSLPKVR
jgi:hypothetical protein